MTMTTKTTRDEIETRLLAGETVEAIAEDLGLDVVNDESGEPMVALPGYVADDGNAEVEYELADSGKEAAKEYVSDGDWGDDRSSSSWVTVYTWRRGLRLQTAECCRCIAPATAHDAEGDPACEDHACAPEAGVTLKPLLDVIESDTDRVQRKVEIEPEAPDCDGGAEHDWASPHEIVGGIKENPGVWGHGGGIVSRSVCRRCGCGRKVDTWAQDPTDGQQGLTSTSYEAGEYSDQLADCGDEAQ